MTTLDKFTRRRIETANDNVGMRPQDVLRFAADEIDAGRQRADSMVLLLINRPEGGEWEYDSYRANLSRDQELVALVLAQESCIRRWRGSGRG